MKLLTLILLTWRIWRTPNNASKWQMGLNSVFEVLIFYICLFLTQQPPPPLQWARASSFTMFLDHTQRRTTVGRTPLDE
jgi:hypothetical protein